jgi:predicted nucleotidyltransferase
MKTIEEIKKILREHKKELKKKYKVKDIGIFGSYVRGDAQEMSDVDILVEFEEPVGFEFIHLADFLEEILGTEVDLTTKDSIKPNRWHYIKEDLIYV